MVDEKHLRGNRSKKRNFEIFLTSHDEIDVGEGVFRLHELSSVPGVEHVVNTVGVNSDGPRR